MFRKLKNIDNFLKQRRSTESFCSSIAIIDDLESNRSFLQHLAQRLPGVRYVSTFVSAIDALEAFAHAGPDLVITDFSMPGMNGAEFLEKFRAMPDYEDVPVIVVSSHNETKNRHRALLAGATDFLMVPFDTFEFQARTCNLLKLSLHQKALKTQSRSLRSELIESHSRSLKTQHRFTSIIDSVPALVFAIDGNGECVFANQYCFDYFGLAAEGGAPAVQFLADKVKPKAAGAGREGSQQPLEICLTGQDGRRNVFLIVPKPVKEGGEHTDLIVYSGIEITQLKDTERSLRGAKDAAETANRAKSAFLSNMTHEIRTPLNAILGFSDVIRSELHGPVGNEKYRGYLHDIQASARHLLTIVDEILDFSQIEGQKQTLTLTNFSVKDCLHEVAALMEKQLQSRNNVLVLKAVPDIELHCDRQKLVQVLINIVSHANMATKNGTIHATGALHEGGGCVLTVKDSGVGMDENELALAVTEFGRAMKSAFVSDGRSWTGLGLPIAIRYMAMLGGELNVESGKSTGTTVRMTLPGSAIWSAPKRKRGAARPALRSGKNGAGAPKGA
jgi:signal transduction histidine kinase/DNA-binding NarL/FixJ family response regulator